MAGGISLERSNDPDVVDAGNLRPFLTPTHLRWLGTDPDQRWRELEASLLFADVSGFTRIGERLARRGRIGAEQLTDAINLVFAEMVAAIDAGAGELVKFGGDAILALFYGDGHERRACEAGLELQRRLTTLRALPGRSADNQLRVSAGVASGTVHLFLSGSAPAEMIVAGPLASEVTALEGEAEASEILVSAATLAALPPSWAGERKGDGILLAELPPPGDPELVSVLTVEDTLTDVDPLPGLPLHLHGHEPADGEHRTVTVAFLQIRETDELLRSRGPEALAAALDEIVGAACEACRTWGVTLIATDVDHDACKLFLCAGAPTASPDDDDRILHALLSITEREWPLPVRAGVNHGQAFAVDIGNDVRRVWSVMGDTVNLAARVMGKSEPGGLLATESVLERVRDDFTREPVAPFKVKGKTAEVRAQKVGGARGIARAAPAADTPFVGRDKEMGILREALTVARRRGGVRVVELVAEPGLGKSRLVEAILAEADDMIVVRIAAGPYGAHTPYLALRAPMRSILGIPGDADDRAAAAQLRKVIEAVEPALEPWLPLIAQPLGIELPPTPETESLAPEFARQRLHAAVAHLLDVLVPEMPSLIVIEDAHWLDDASSEFLRYLLESDRERGPARGWGVGDGPSEADLPPVGVAAVITRRPVAEGMQLAEIPAVRIDLEPLGFEDARLILLADSELALTPAERGAVLERADGNPLLLQELVAALRAGRSLEELPDSVEALMTARIDTLPLRERRLLRDAAVLGIYVPVEELTELLGFEPEMLAATLEPLRGEFLVEENPSALRFRHALLRSAAYGTLSFKRRRGLHARAAELIERRLGADSDSEPELIAIHYHAAGRWRESWHYSRLAGERALRNAAPVESAGFYAGALEAARHIRGLDPGERAAVAEALGAAAELAGQYERASQAFSRARKLRAGDPIGEAELCLKQGMVAEASRHLSDALRWFTRGLRLLEDAPGGRAADSLHARLTLAHGATRLRAGRLRECLPYLDQAVALAKRSRDRAALAHAYYLLDWAHTDLGHPEAERFRDLALPIFEELGDHARQGRVLNNLGVNAQYDCRWDEAVEYFERSKVAAEKAGDAVEGVGTALNNIAEIRLDQGRIDEAEELLREALASWRAARYRVGTGTALKNLGRIATRRGDYERAKELLEQARAEFEAIGSAALLAETDAWEAERLVFAGENEKAMRLIVRLSEEETRADLTPSLVAARERLSGQAAIAGGADEIGIEMLRRSAALAAKADARFDEALALLELAGLGEASAEEEAYARSTLKALEVVGEAAPTG